MLLNCSGILQFLLLSLSNIWPFNTFLNDFIGHLCITILPGILWIQEHILRICGFTPPATELCFFRVTIVDYLTMVSVMSVVFTFSPKM
jgi:hypothetical protein